MLEVTVSFAKKQAVVRFEIGKVGVAQIVKRYVSTPFDVSPAGPVTTILRQDRVTVRAWADPAKLVNVVSAGQEPAPPVAIFVEFVPDVVHRFAAPPSVSPVGGVSDRRLKLVRDVAETIVADPGAPGPLGPGVRRFEFAVRAESHIEPGPVSLPIEFRYTALDPGGKRHDGEGKVIVVLDAVATDGRLKTQPATGVKLVGGALELGLGHLCDQTGCVEHLHESLAAFSAVVGVRPRPSQTDPRATLFVEARQPIDLWGMRQRLREQGIEVRHMVAADLGSFECHIDLPRWRVADRELASQCQKCRDRTLATVRSLAWTSEATLAGAGVTIRTRDFGGDLCTPLNRLEEAGIAPCAVWLVPANVPMPKPTAPRVVSASAGPKTRGSESHPLIQFDFGHASAACPGANDILAEQVWASRTGTAAWDLGSIDERLVLPGAAALAAVDDRQRADLSPLIRAWQARGQQPTRIRLTDFGDLRVQFEFAHLCGDVEYSKPPKKDERKPDEKKADAKHAEHQSPAEKNEATASTASQTPNANAGVRSESQEASKDEPKKDGAKQEPAKEEKPFVPQPLRPAASSNARQAIERAIAGVKWVQEGTYHDYHTKAEFDGPRKLTLTLRPAGDGVVPLDELTRALAQAGFPPTAVRVSRLFPGLPFGHALPADLELVTSSGAKRSLASFRRVGRPLAAAFVSLNCPKWDKYKYEADAKLFAKLKQTVESYADRVDFVAISANPDDEFSKVVEFWTQIELPVPLLHDVDGRARATLNAQTTPPPHLFIFDADGLMRYAGDPHSNWNKPADVPKDFLGPALDAVLAGKYAENRAVSFNSSKCNCSSPNCKCPKCGCGPSCRCDIGH